MEAKKMVLLAALVCWTTESRRPVLVAETLAGEDVILCQPLIS